jgi:hypothetical protein
VRPEYPGLLARPAGELVGRRLAEDAEVLAESPAEVAAEREHDPAVVVDDEKYGTGYLLPGGGLNVLADVEQAG